MIDLSAALPRGSAAAPRPAGPALEGQARGNEPSKIRDAARQFEALLLGQMLKSARAGSSDAFGGETDASTGCAMDFAQEQVASLLAQRGGLGIANVITAGLEKASSQSKE